MGVRGQGAIVPKPVEIVASEAAGSSLAAVPSMGQTRPILDSTRAKKQQRV